MTLAVAMLCVPSAFAALGADTALAARGHVFSAAFGKHCETEPCAGGEFQRPVAVAANEATGDVYVADGGQNRIERFGPDGEYKGYFDGSGTYEVEGKVETGTKAGFGGRPNEVESGKLRLGSSGGSIVAVDNSCQQHQPVLTGSACEAFDPSDGDVYVVDQSQYLVDKFGPRGEYIGQITAAGEGRFEDLHEEFEEETLIGVAVNDHGEVWVYGTQSIDFQAVVHLNPFSDAEQNAFEGAKAITITTQQINISPGEQTGIAVNAAGDFYLEDFHGFIVELGPKGELVNPQVSPEEAEQLAVEASTGDVYLDNRAYITRLSPQAESLESLGAEQLTDEAATSVAVDSATETVYVVDREQRRVDIYTPEPEGHPTVSGESSSDVGDSSATLSAQIDPRGPNTEYRFEYGPCASIAVASCATSPYTAAVPSEPQSIGGGFELVETVHHVQQLQPHTTYHFRVAAANADGPAAANEVTFTTQSVVGSLTLPDDRQWELVSPANLHGAFMEPIGYPVVQAAADGDAFADYAPVPNETNPLPAGTANGVEVISGRGPNGWVSRDVAATGGGREEFPFFSEDLSLAVLQPVGRVEELGGFRALTPAATEQTAYLHSDFPAGEPASPCDESADHGACLQPLVSAANVPAGTAFGEMNADNECHPSESPFFFPEGNERRVADIRPAVCGPRVVGASPDGHHIVLEAGAQLTSTPTEGRPELYEWSAGTLELVSTMPTGQKNSGGGVAAEEPVLGQENRDVRDAVSTDGSHVIFESYPQETLYVHLREGAGGQPETLQVGTGRYTTASADGSRIFFLQGSELYEYDLDAPLASRSTLLAKGVVNVLGASEDGSYVYFVSQDALTPGASAGECDAAAKPTDTNLCNLYEYHDGATTLVAALSQRDYSDWAGSSPVYLQQMTARVSPNGRYLAFMSDRSLTGYDNRDALDGQPDQEVYLYDAQATGAGRPALVCVSCTPTGARPLGEENAPSAVFPGFTAGPHEHEHLAALVPPWTAGESQTGGALHQPRYLTDEGRVFFDTPQPLAPQDVNGTWDVYEYEPPGVGSCTAVQPDYSERLAGCQSLISSGSSGQPSVFLDASETGGDVFFLTSERLAPEDHNSAPHVYDARECTAAAGCYPPAPVAPPPCESGEACKTAPAPQPSVFGAPPSATFSGAGNLAPKTATPAVKPKAKAKPKKSKPATRAQKLKRALRACARLRGRRRRRSCEAQANRNGRAARADAAHTSTAARRGR